jgi:ornithine carbamoyltransferase
MRKRAAMTVPRHFIDLKSQDRATLRRIINSAAKMKKALASKSGAKARAKARTTSPGPLAGKVLAMIFEKPSTRTRVSFEVAMHQLGGATIMLRGDDSQLGRGESIADTARVLSRYVDAIVVRTSMEQRISEFAASATVPVINGLSDQSHPCQIMADIMTFEEKLGPIKGKIVAWAGDGNNVANTWIEASAKFGFELRLACPPPLRPPAALIKWAIAEGAKVQFTDRVEAAVAGAHCVVTDCWISMGMAPGNRAKLLTPYQVNERVMAQARKNAIFMHCLPAHRGEEVTAAVIDGPQSVVLDEAENRLHAQKGILAWCLEN